ncbi:hypothetical protein GLYMA_01G155150v4 [Glycine max]|nr:hypothetical protein GLYMA_01G155150v4 [Glycine max]
MVLVVHALCFLVNPLSLMPTELNGCSDCDPFY